MNGRCKAPWRSRSAPTEHIAILRRGGDPPAVNLHVFPAGAAVELVDADLAAAQLVRPCALRPHILLKMRRRVILPLFMQGKNEMHNLRGWDKEKYNNRVNTLDKSNYFYN